ncbi:ligase-associated DNA damage response DEXH box helicase [Rhodopseudomonas palustris]|uniref:Ligase-associated DNA damage response DEXH box helicase n=1 Tax=Rhodopseudomonas palustris TaxID=1076 RepID=A0A418UYW7_RHOPL|nr:ligase-associated DNA damage response DEXH box helicase [Rhodopseudomonas palustris]RJF68551.1 ligase-associated DNA damage response DEXH box helicase [Rhodopseudomonas palustris]
MSPAATESAIDLLPERFRRWFVERGWAPRAHQLALLERARASRAALLIAPTGAGKTLAGFLPTLVELSEAAPRAREEGPSRGLHTLYISPLKALAVDIARNLEAPIAQMGLPIRVETRTGDTPVSRRARQRKYPPDILLTTPEQLALLLASDDGPFLFGSLRRIILDELHALVTSKRGDLLSLGLARLWRIAPQLRATGLSATVADPDELARFLVPQPFFLSPLVGEGGAERSEATGEGARTGAAPAAGCSLRPSPTSGEGADQADIVVASGAAQPIVEMLDTKERLPWAGHSARHALSEIYDLIKRNKTTLVFVNTRSQAEMLFQELWRMNDDNLAIALHHGSLDVTQRRRVEDAMTAGKLRGVVCTSSLDLGIDWGDIDLVINVGAPKGASRLMQRIGRANHRLDEASRAVLVPANRFEVLECAAAIDAVAENAQDTPPQRTGALDVLAQHILGCACGEPFFADDLYREVRSAAPYADLSRADFDDTLDFVATGGYALKSYERFAKIKQDKQGRWRVANPKVRQSYRLNVGTIVEEAMLKVKLVRSAKSKGSGHTGVIARGGRMLGQIEEGFIEGLSMGDTFVFGGEVVRYEALVEDQVYVSRAHDKDARVPSYLGGKFPLSTYLAERVRGLLADKRAWTGLPDQVRDWLALQTKASRIPGRTELVVETFPRANKNYLVCYPFEGRLAHQTLGMLLTRRLERARARPLGFVANEYALAVWGIGDTSQMIRQGRLDLDALFDPDMLGDDLEAWLAESALMKRTFRYAAIIAGLIARRFAGEEKTRRQVLFSTDLVYDVLNKHQPDHVLLRAARADAATGLLDLRRLSDMLTRIKGHIVHKELDRVSPLAVPVMLEIGREPVYGEASDELLAEAADELVREAMEDPTTRRMG